MGDPKANGIRVLRFIATDVLLRRNSERTKTAHLSGHPCQL